MATLRRRILQYVAATLHVFAALGCLAEDYPTKPVRLVLSFGAPGGTPDINARLVGAKLTDWWGKQVVIDPRSGAGGILGSTRRAEQVPPASSRWM